MLTNALRRQFSTQAPVAASINPESYARIRQYKGANINVASHNQERRSEYQGEFGFNATWGMGIEGFSKPVHGLKMHPTVGGKHEYKWLLAMFIVLPIIGAFRRKNELGLAAEIKANNTYSKMNLDKSASQLNQKWTL